MTETTSMQPLATGGYEATRFNALRRGVRWLRISRFLLTRPLTQLRP
jgi:hypothetical protein